jgi:hypothetical protein
MCFLRYNIELLIIFDATFFLVVLNLILNLLAGDNSCRIYNNRPSNCRLLRVKSPAYHCSKQATRRGQGKIFDDLEQVWYSIV